jgi:hypothetical protein
VRTCQPTLYWKNAAAQGLAFTLDPRLLYRGTGASVLNEMVQMSVQLVLTRMFQRIWEHRRTEERSAAELLTTSCSGGITASFAASPIELAMIQQQRNGGSFIAACSHIVGRYGLGSQGLMRGLGPTMLRDGVYVAGLLGLTPVLQARLVDQYGCSQAGATLGASLVGGSLCALASHPADMIKTCMQGDLQRLRFTSPLASLRLLLREGGIRRMYRGCVSRTINITATIYIVNECMRRCVTQYPVSKYYVLLFAAFL